MHQVKVEISGREERSMDRFAYLRALAADCVGAPLPDQHRLFAGSCCFFDGRGQLLYFAPTPRNDDSTQLQLELLEAEEGAAVHAVFDSALTMLLRPGMVARVNVLPATAGRPQALAVAFKHAAAAGVTMQVWSEGEDATAVNCLEGLAQILSRMAGDGDRRGKRASGATQSLDAPEPRVPTQTAPKRRRTSGGVAMDQGTLDAASTVSDRINGWCTRVRQHQDSALRVCRALAHHVPTIMNATGSHGSGASVGTVPVAHADAELNLLARTLGILHGVGAEAAEHDVACASALQQAHEVLKHRVGSQLLSASDTLRVCGKDAAADLHADAPDRNKVGLAFPAGEAEKMQHMDELETAIAISRELQLASVELSLLSCWSP